MRALIVIALVACTAEEPTELVTSAPLTAKGPVGWDTFRRLDRLPFLAHGVQSRELSAFDRDNGNEDGFAGVYSCLRTTSAGCLLAEDRGAGELTSVWFTQINPSPDGIPDEGDVRPTGRIRIELDGQTVVDARLQDVVDGKLGAPFVYPMVANALQASGGVYIKVPMPYRQSMRVTVQNNPRFYHVNYRHFPDAEGVTTFDKTDPALDVIDLVKAAGTRDPKPPVASTTTSATQNIPAGQARTFATLTGPAAISRLRIRFPGVASPDVLARTRLRIAFDGKATVDAPIGDFFGTGLGASTVRSLMFAADPSPGGWYTTWWPMPFRNGAAVEVVNDGAPLVGVEVQVSHAADPQWTAALAPDGSAGYFTAIGRAGETTPREDWVVADVRGRGKLVGVVQTMKGLSPIGNLRGYLEGDERVHVDGILSPHWHGTGTEDFYEAGWYFARGTYSAPFLGNTGHLVHTPTCAQECDATYRLLIGDAIPYATSLRFGVEHGPQNDALAFYSSTAFLYTQPTLALRRTDAIDVGDAASRAAHAYTDTDALAVDKLGRYEGDTSEQPIAHRTRTTSAPIELRMAIDPANTGVLLRRTSDQGAAFQAARVLVDGVDAGVWLQVRGNAFAAWLADDFAIPATLVANKSQVTITIRPEPGSPGWSAARYTADALVAGWTDATPPQAPARVHVTNGRRHAIWLAWSEPFDDSSIDVYRIYAAVAPNVPITPANLVGTSRTLGFTHGPLPPNATRYYRVVAVDAAGNAGPPSAELSATTRPMSNGVDGDGRMDLVTFTRGQAADVWVGESTGTAFGAGTKRHDFFAISGEVPMLGDFDGDGRDDLVTFTRGNAADVYVALSTGTGFGPGVKWHDFFALGNEIPMVGDFNGDGRDDIVTFTRGNTADVWVALSTGTGFGPGMKWSDNFAVGTETPAVGDLDGDGRDDIVTFTQDGNADVYVALSDSSRFIGGDFGVLQRWHEHFAPPGEVPGVADIDGDGRADIVTFTRGTSADVWIARSNGRSFGAGTKIHDGFAFRDEVPGLGDVDGDGKADLLAFSRGADADVFVSRGFGPRTLWSDWFAPDDEWPQPSLLRP